MAYFFLGCLTGIFACCIFFRRWANFVAGFLGVWRWLVDMAVSLHSNSTGPGLRTVE
jgi:hypothetical protein